MKNEYQTVLIDIIWNFDERDLWSLFYKSKLKTILKDPL